MHLRALRAAFLVVVIILLAGLLANCGGGGQSEGGSQEGDSGGSQQQGDGGGSEQQRERTDRQRKAHEVKIALGTIETVTPDENRFTLQPSTEEQGEEPIPFDVRPNTRVTIGGEEAELEALEEGQQANVNYVSSGGQNRARSVSVIGE